MTKTPTVSGLALAAAVALSSAAFAQAPAGGPPAAAAPGAAPRAPQPPQPPVVFMSGADVAKLLEQSKSEHQGNAPNAPYKPLVRVPGYRAQLEYRYNTGTTNPSIHLTNNEFVYVMKGTGTLTMGGTLEGQTPAGGNINGKSITGGTPYPLTEGTFIIVPANTAHGIATTDPAGLEIFTMFLPVQGAPAPGMAPAGGPPPAR